MVSNWMTSITRHANQYKKTYKYVLLVPAIFTRYPWVMFSMRTTSTIPITIGTPSDQYLIPGDTELLNLSDMQLLDMFTKYINSYQIMCRNHLRLGSLGDGGKEICVDSIVIPKSPCLVYSFGVLAEDKERDIETTKKSNGQQIIIHIAPDSNNKFDFEEEVIRKFGCEVLTFDPTMGNLSVHDLHIPRGCKFYLKGLDGADIPSKSFYRMSTLLDEHGHRDRVIDILKIDIEGSEWAAIEDMKMTGVLRNVRQLLIEFHFHRLSQAQKVRAMRVFRILYEEGFLAYSRERNSGKSELVPQLGYRVAYFVEISYINLRFI